MWSEMDSRLSERGFGDMDLDEFNTVHKVDLRVVYFAITSFLLSDILSFLVILL